ncbi:MAG: type II toxin-antitoxin system VapC family toxin [Novosphingobium sp.]|nr:type II toxin-antitoxin system VapC family toxin [Novosphingobium sp.]
MILDTNVVIDLIDGAGSADFVARIAALQSRHSLVVNEIIFAEISSRYASADDVFELLSALRLRLIRLSLVDCHRAGAAFGVYRREGRSRTTILPDFLIGAQAEGQGWPIVTRDRKGFAKYFPKVDLIDPYEGS